MTSMHLRHVSAVFLALLLLAACQREGTPPTGSPGPATPAAEDANRGGGPDEAPKGDAPPAPDRSTEAGAEYPGLVVTTLDGTRYDLADRRGRWVVVNFWATWCAPCLEEMPELSALDAMREHIEVIGLAYEDTDAATLRSFLDARPVVYPVAIVDMYDPPRDFPTPRGLPLTCLVAPDGRLVKTFLGPITAAALEEAIEAAGGPAPGRSG
jgi:thiol-disulfide isomerase/thioredoxin